MMIALACVIVNALVLDMFYGPPYISRDNSSLRPLEMAMCVSGNAAAVDSKTINILLVFRS